MVLSEPRSEILDPTGQGAPEADDNEPTPWVEACRRFGEGGWFWLATVQPDGAPHVMPVFAAWDTAAFFVASSETSRKSRNLVREGRCVVSKDAGDLHLVVEGIAQRVLDDATLERASQAFASVYGWPTIMTDAEHDPDLDPGLSTDRGPGDGVPTSDVPPYAVWEIRPTTAFGFPVHSESFPPTRWRFTAGAL